MRAKARLMLDQCRQPDEAQRRQYLWREALALGRGRPAAVARLQSTDLRLWTLVSREVFFGKNKAGQTCRLTC